MLKIIWSTPDLPKKIDSGLLQIHQKMWIWSTPDFKKFSTPDPHFLVNLEYSTFLVNLEYFTFLVTLEYSRFTKFLYLEYFRFVIWSSHFTVSCFCHSLIWNRSSKTRRWSMATALQTNETRCTEVSLSMVM